mgnify:CR=1 FL=1
MIVVLRQQKYLRAKTGGLEEEMDDDAEEEEEKERAVWGRAKSTFYNAENIDYEVKVIGPKGECPCKQKLID